MKQKPEMRNLIDRVLSPISRATFCSFMLVMAYAGSLLNAQVHTARSLIRTQTISLPSVSGRIDHMSLDTAGKRLFVAALGNNSLEVVDLQNRRLLRTLPDVPEVQDVKYLEKLNLICLSCGSDGTVRFYDDRTYELRKKIDVGDDADNMRYDPVGKLLYVGYGDGGIAIIDVNRLELVTTIPLPAHPESFQFGENHARLFVNTPGAGCIIVIDLERRAVLRRISLREARSNFPMAVDNRNKRIFVGCRNPALLLVLNAITDSVVGRLPIDADCDDIFFDETSGTAYLSCGAGAIDVVQQMTPDRYARTQRIKTAPGARTCLLAQGSDELFLAVPRHDSSAASIFLFQMK